MPMPSAKPTQNAFVHALPEPERRRLTALSTPLTLEQGAILFEPGERLDACYFPFGSVISLVTVIEDGESIAAGLIGREGMVGFGALLGESRIPWRVVGQLTGGALRVPVDRLLDDGTLADALRPLAMRYQAALYWLAKLTIACNWYHAGDQRAARCLLMLNDLNHRDHDLIETTPEFLAQMLGEPRQDATEALRVLEEQGVVRHEGDGRLRLLDRPGLEALACECYSRIAPQFSSQDGPPTRP
jgi:CRP-like cAMP-binding protein